MSQLEAGQATIVYEDPEEGTKEVTVENEQAAYVRDHWAVKAGTDDEGNDLMKQIPATRVHYVERNVQQFEEEITTVRHRVESFADEIRQKLPIDVGQGSQEGEQPRGQSPTQIQTDPSAQSSTGDGDRSSSQGRDESSRGQDESSQDRNER